MKAVKKSFIVLKQAFLAVGFLAQFDPDYLVVVEANALDYVLGGCLLQLDLKMGILYLVVFYSRKLISIEKWYEIYNKEMLIIVEYLKQ